MTETPSSILFVCLFVSGLNCQEVQMICSTSFFPNMRLLAFPLHAKSSCSVSWELFLHNFPLRIHLGIMMTLIKRSVLQYCQATGTLITRSLFAYLTDFNHRVLGRIRNLNRMSGIETTQNRGTGEGACYCAKWSHPDVPPCLSHLSLLWPPHVLTLKVPATDVSESSI